MLEACAALDVAFRPHIKTHKTLEVTRLQVGESSQDVKVVVSTVAEAEMLLDYLFECQRNGRSVNVLYGVPIPPSAVRRLSQVGKQLSPGSVSVLVDHYDQLKHLGVFKEATGYPLHVFIKIDTGYGRAGVVTESSQFRQLLSHLLNDSSISNCTKFSGLYSHSGHSYAGSTASQAMDILVKEIESLARASTYIKSLHDNLVSQSLTLSVGATPTATSVQNLVHTADSDHTIGSSEDYALGRCIRNVKANHDVLELHAGVYAFLDLQQLATQASPSAANPSAGLGLSTTDIAFTVLAEVVSFYEERKTSEALIAAGTLALGREPCKSYQGWGIVSSWGIESTRLNGHSGWQIGRISQEHGVLVGFHSDTERLSVGQKLRIFPNHACVAGALFGWYIVVDSDLPQSRNDEIVDIWVRSRGW
ncbi:MAG: hypothetical protein Q9228_002921 [Teloschistes exilis]